MPQCLLWQERSQAALALGEKIGFQQLLDFRKAKSLHYYAWLLVLRAMRCAFWSQITLERRNTIKKATSSQIFHILK